MKHVPFPDEGPLVEIPLRRCLLILTEAELLALLRRDPELWQAALQRGKAVRRRRQAARRGPERRRPR